MLKIALEYEGPTKKVIAIYKDGLLIDHQWLIREDDEHRIFDILCVLLRSFN